MNPRYAAAVAQIGPEAFAAELAQFRDWQRTVHRIRTAERLTAEAKAEARA